MAHLWTSLRIAVERLRISRTRKKGVSKIRAFERKKRVRRRIASPSAGCCSRTLRKELKEVLLVRYRSSSSSSASLRPASRSGSEFALLSSAEDDENNVETTEADDNSSEQDVEVDVDVDDSTPLFPRQIGRSSSSSYLLDSRRMERKSLAPAWSSLDFDSSDWEQTIMVNSISMRPGFRPGDPEISSRSHFHQYRYDNRDWRLSYRTPQLMQPVRWRVATLSGLLRTTSDRFARRTGKLTPFHEKLRKQPLAKCFSPLHWTRSKDRSSSPAKSPRTPDLTLRRYDNPYQDFLKRATEERNARLVKVKE